MRPTCRFTTAAIHFRNANRSIVRGQKAISPIRNKSASPLENKGMGCHFFKIDELRDLGVPPSIRDFKPVLVSFGGDPLEKKQPKTKDTNRPPEQNEESSLQTNKTSTWQESRIYRFFSFIKDTLLGLFQKRSEPFVMGSETKKFEKKIQINTKPNALFHPFINSAILSIKLRNAILQVVDNLVYGQGTLTPHTELAKKVVDKILFEPNEDGTWTVNLDTVNELNDTQKNQFLNSIEAAIEWSLNQPRHTDDTTWTNYHPAIIADPIRLEKLIRDTLTAGLQILDKSLPEINGSLLSVLDIRYVDTGMGFTFDLGPFNLHPDLTDALATYFMDNFPIHKSGVTPAPAIIRLLTGETSEPVLLTHAINRNRFPELPITISSDTPAGYPIRSLNPDLVAFVKDTAAKTLREMILARNTHPKFIESILNKILIKQSGNSLIVDITDIRSLSLYQKLLVLREIEIALSAFE